jgi:transcriptional regulator with XRE-family HTH domain
MDIRRRVGLNIKQARSAKGWSQEELADRAQLHRTYVSSLERGQRNPTASVLERLGSALGVTPGSLLDATPA